MLTTVKNDDEIAFILSHEAGHQIARHLMRRASNQALGAWVALGAASAAGITDREALQTIGKLGGAFGALSYSKEHELEADRLGTIIAHQAGYDPVLGAKSFARFPGSSSFLSTHPPSNARYQTVLRTAAQLKQ